MSLALEPITRRSSGSPQARATQPESTLPKLPVGHGEREPAAAERVRRPDVVRHLRRDARPVDRVGGGQPDALAEGHVAEQLLDDALAVVERAVDRDGVHVGRRDRRHLAALDVAHAALGVEHDDLGAAARREPGDRGRARVARGRDEHRDALVALRQDVLEEPADELQREILEGQRRPVEELEQPLVGVELDERADRRMAEVRRRPRRTAARAAPARARRPRTPRRRRRRRARTARRARRAAAAATLGHVEAAVAREPGEQRVAEAERGRAAAGRDVAHASDRRGPGSRDAPRRELGAGPLGLDAQQPVPLGRALGALRRADLDLAAAPADREVGQPARPRCRPSAPRRTVA